MHQSVYRCTHTQSKYIIIIICHHMCTERRITVGIRIVLYHYNNMHREWVHLKAGNFIVACVTVDQLSSHYIVAHGPVAPTSTSTQVHRYMHNNQLTSKCSYSSTLNLEKSRNPCSKAYSSTGAFYTLATIDRGRQYHQCTYGMDEIRCHWRVFWIWGS